MLSLNHCEVFLLGVWFLVTFLKKCCNSIITYTYYLLFKSLDQLKNLCFEVNQSLSCGIGFDPNFYNKIYIYLIPSNVLLPSVKVDINFIKKYIY